MEPTPDIDPRASPQPAGALPVSVIHCLGAEQRESLSLRVHCPRRGNVAVSECAACLSCSAVHVNLADREWSVQCQEAARTTALADADAPAMAALAPVQWCAHLRASVLHAAEVMLENGLEALTIVDHELHPVAVMTLADLVWAATQRSVELEDAVVEDVIQSQSLRTALEVTPLREIWSAARDSTVVLVDSEGGFVGCLRDRELLVGALHARARTGAAAAVA